MKMMPTQLIILSLFCVLAQTISAARPQQWRGTVLSEVIKGRGADKVWPLFEDFCNIYEVFPIDVSFCTLPLTTPATRYLSSQIALPGKKEIDSTIVIWERQQVLELNSKKRFLSYETLENNQGIKSYIATVSILQNKDGSQIKWDFLLDPVVKYTIDTVKNSLKTILAGSVAKIEAKLAKPTP